MGGDECEFVWKSVSIFLLVDKNLGRNGCFWHLLASFGIFWPLTERRGWLNFGHLFIFKIQRYGQRKREPAVTNFSGQLGKQFVVKQYKNKIVISAYPNIKKKKPTALASLYQSRFNDAVKYTRTILQNPELKAEYAAKLEPGQRVCDYVMSAYLKQIKAEEGPFFNY